MKNTPAHVIISAVFLIIIGMVFGYSYFFYPNDHPVDCAIKAATGKDCATCGFSRAFSCFTHLEFQSGKAFNANALKVFVFFLVQFVLRSFIVGSFLLTRRALPVFWVKADAIVSAFTFLYIFLPFLL